MDQHRTPGCTGWPGIRSFRASQYHVYIVGMALKPLTHHSADRIADVLTIIGKAKFNTKPAFGRQADPPSTTVWLLLCLTLGLSHLGLEAYGVP